MIRRFGGLEALEIIGPMQAPFCKRGFNRTVACAASVLLLGSCATLRLQTLADNRLPLVRVSTAGDDRSLGMLMGERDTDLRLKKQLSGGAGTNAAPSAGELAVPSGTKVLIFDETKKRCKGLAVFTRVRIAEGPNKDVEGWVCGAFLTHHKAAAL